MRKTKIKPINVVMGFIALIWMSLASMNSFAEATVPPLAADQAFAVSTTITRANELFVEFRIAPGYYLYAKHVSLKFKPQIPSTITIPQGDLKYDPDRGNYEVLSGDVLVPINLQAHVQKVQLDIAYQGCSQDGFCYPPMHKTMLLNMMTKTITPVADISSDTTTQSASTMKDPITSLSSLLTNQNGVQALFQTQHLGLLLLIFVGLGLLLAFTPCVLPMIPILTSIIVGQKKSVSTKKAFLLSSTYVLGTAITYAIAGLIAASMGNSLQVWLQKPWIILLTSALFGLLALSLFGVYSLQFPQRWQNRITQLSNQQQGGSYVGVLLMGILSTLIVSPCVTAPLVGVLMYIGRSGDLLLGASALFAMGIGMGIPLLFIGTSAGKWLPKTGSWMEAVKKAVGILMLGMAIWLCSRVVSPVIAQVLWGLLLLGTALFFAFYLPSLIGKHHLNRSFGAIVGCAGLFLMVSGTGLSTITNHGMAVKQSISHPFTIVKNIDDLNKQLADAQASGRSVILDFYADWCESCVVMDRNVFDKPDVQKVLANYVLLRADLTNNTMADETLLKHFAVVAPPTVLFFDGKGREINSQRIVGEVNAKEFLSRINFVAASASCKKDTKC